MAFNLAKATRYNRITARTVGWLDKSEQVFEVLGFRGASPDERAFAGAVEGWQGTHGLRRDGMLGPRTWAKLEPLTRHSPAGPTPPRAVDWCKMAPAPPARGKMLVSEGDVTAGALVVNDAYDLALYEMSDGNYELALFMKIQFFFESGEGGDWTSGEKTKFMFDWKIAILGAWSGRRLHTTKSGKTVSLTIEFAIQEGGWMLDHWEMTVTKIKAGSFRTSYVAPGRGNVVLDSEDLTPVSKGAPGQLQQGAVHEFGHMLGLEDEYPVTSPNAADQPSVMHSGATVRNRHEDGPRAWLLGKLQAYGIE